MCELSCMNLLHNAPVKLMCSLFFWSRTAQFCETGYSAYCKLRCSKSVAGKSYIYGSQLRLVQPVDIHLSISPHGGSAGCDVYVLSYSHLRAKP